MGCDAGPTFNRNLGGRLTSSVEVHRRQVLNKCWPALAMVVEEIHVEDIFEFVSLVLSSIISWIIKILAHEKDQCTVVFRKY